ncbi:MAG: primosomal protein N' [Rickettsiales bacterium]|nr:primosomal protein N' [Rickettsiales bacterium]
MKIAEIIVPLRLYGTFDYLVAEEEPVLVGSIVRVPFRSGGTVGLVTATRELTNENTAKLKNIREILTVPPLRPELVKFICWVADYNVAPPGLLLKLVFSEKYAVGPGKVLSKYSYRNNDYSGKLTRQRQSVINFLRDNFPREFSSGELKCFCSATVLKKLVEDAIIAENRVRESIRDAFADKISKYTIDLEKITLNELSLEQKIANDDILNLLKSNGKPVLLEGITSSGKTEVYFHLIEKILRENDRGQILFLLPEIALTSQFVNRFKRQFNCEDVALWHSGISESNRKIIWNAVNDGKIRFVMGARSSLFLPFYRLALVIVDEEHDGSYKQSDKVCYNARDMAVVRAYLNGCPIILGSATPSLESLFNVENKKYSHVTLYSRFGNSTIPAIEIIDLTTDKLKPDNFISSRLAREMEFELARGKQVLLFMNRRGYAPVALCNSCGYRFICSRCAIALAVHGKEGFLICHHCGQRIKIREECPGCGLKNSLIFFGPGVEKVEKELGKLFPEKNIAIVTSDTVQTVENVQSLLEKILENKVDIIVGTQMITKGYDFPNITLVGVLDADASLFGANFRSAERTHQLLTQVVGRAGRKTTSSRAMIQTHSPTNVIIEALKNNDRNLLASFERENRKIAGLPPYGRVTLLVLGGRDEQMVHKKMEEIVAILPPNDEFIEVFGPTQFYPFKLNGSFRFKLIIKTKNNFSIKKLIFHIFNNVKFGSKLKLKVEVDPYYL